MEIKPPEGISKPTSFNIFNGIEKSPRSLKQEERNIYEKAIHQLNFDLTQQNQKVIGYKRKIRDLEEKLRWSDISLQIARHDIEILSAELKEAKCLLGIKEIEKEEEKGEHSAELEKKKEMLKKCIDSIKDINDI